MTDGKVPVFPIKAYKKGAAGAVSLEITRDGVAKFNMRVNVPLLDTNRYVATLVLTGLHNGEDGHILVGFVTHSLTVGGNPLGGSPKRKSWTFHIAPATLKLLRHYHLVLDRDKSEPDLVDRVVETIRRTGEIWEEADALYKKVKDSELGEDIALAAA